MVCDTNMGMSLKVVLLIIGLKEGSLHQQTKWVIFHVN